MDYSLSIKNLFAEVSRLKSYSRLHPVLRVIVTIFMLPFIVSAAAMVVVYSVLCFFRNAWQIISDELESWLKSKEQDKHWGPTVVIYYVSLPFIFLVRALMAVVFSGAIYIAWFFIMMFAYVASLGSIRWQPYLNKVDYSKEYCWGFKHSDKAFNVLAIINVGFVALCVVQAVINENGLQAWLIAITAFMIYVAYPIMFAKKNMREVNGAEEIYNEARSYENVR